MNTGADTVLSHYRMPLATRDLSPFSLQKYGINKTVHRHDPVHNRMISLPTNVPKQTEDLITIIAKSSISPNLTPQRPREISSTLQLPLN